MDAVRTCVACRQRALREELLRVVQRDGQLIIDERSVLPGRGAWVHNAAQCIELGVARGAFLRALKVSGETDTRPLENRLKTLMDN